MARSIHRLRRIGLCEGVSFLVLLGVAMPLKYLADMPLAVRWVGWAHGLLFIGFCAALYVARRQTGWPPRYVGLLFLAALLPFGPFVIDRRLKKEAELHAE
jgi:integral membrane protein